MMDLQDYENMEDLLHKSILIEQQNKRRGTSQNQFGSASRTAYYIDEKFYVKPKEGISAVEKNP